MAELVTDTTAPLRFQPSRPRAWARVVMGWICAQSLLTLLPIAPPGWGTVFLLVTGGGFAVWTVTGLRLALTKRPVVTLLDTGLRIGLDGPEIPWERVRHWSPDQEAGRIALDLDPGALPRWWVGRRPAVEARAIDGGLTDLVQAFRDVRPDLESRA